MRLDEDDSLEAPAFRPKPATGPWLLAVGACGVAGAMFAGVSTADFISHLDRQVHSIHCSIIPGAGAQLSAPRAQPRQTRAGQRALRSPPRRAHSPSPSDRFG